MHLVFHHPGVNLMSYTQFLTSRIYKADTKSYKALKWPSTQTIKLSFFGGSTCPFLRTNEKVLHKMAKDSIRCTRKVIPKNMTIYFHKLNRFSIPIYSVPFKALSVTLPLLPRIVQSRLHKSPSFYIFMIQMHVLYIILPIHYILPSRFTRYFYVF